ncbi:MAG: cytochrome d ubiquinol oxidase subunit II, partial [Hydrogenophaga sp.]|nr:cytochrome d ubiquinol oxidase subunit II [Hydrogenophaga sp.]
MSFDQALPLIFLALMGLSMLVYVLSDGYDLGVGMLLPRATDAEKDIMVASIGPFWDANETWIVLGVGMLLIAFPKAHGLILTELYLPVTLMLVGLVLRGVAFDFRVKAHDSHKAAWNRLFFGGSLLASMMQGWMLGRYISGFGEGWNYPLFAAAIALTLPAAYVLLGAAWLVMKTEGDLQAKAVGWAQQAWWPVVLGMVLISMATPWISTTVRERWFALPQIIALLVIPATTAGALLVLRRVLPTRLVRGELCWLPFVLLIAVFVLGFVGLAYSIYPYVVIDKLTMWQAASSPATLKVTLVGVCISVPAIVAYT